MAYFKYNKEAQDAYSQGNFERLLKVPKEKEFSLDSKKDGDYKLRIMPPWSKEGAFARGSKIHYNVGVEKQHIVCPNTVGDNLCPFCYHHALIKSDEMYQADSNSIRPAYRYFSNVVDMNNPKGGVKVWSYGPNIYYPIKKLQDSGEFGDLTDPIEGHDIIINRQVRGKITDSVFPTNKITALLDPDWLDQIVDLDTILPEVDQGLVDRLFKSHPWKVYEPKQSNGRTTQETPTERRKPVEEPTSAPKADTVPKQGVDDIAARLRAKMAAAKAE